MQNIILPPLLCVVQTGGQGGTVDSTMCQTRGRPLFSGDVRITTVGYGFQSKSELAASTRGDCTPVIRFSSIIHVG